MTKITTGITKQIAYGVGFGLFVAIAVVAFLAPGGAFEGRTASLRTDETPTTTTTISPALTILQPDPTPAVKPITPTTTTTAPVVGPAMPTEKASVSGHYTCPPGMNAATQYNPGPDCQTDAATDPGPNNTSPDYDPALPPAADGDQIGQTLGSTDIAYGDDLAAKACANNPVLCDDYFPWE